MNEIIEDLRPKLAQVPGMKVYLQNPPTIRIGGQVTKSLYQFSHAVAQQAGAVRGRAEAAKRRSRSCRACEDVTSDLAITSPQVNVDIDRDKAAALQVSANAIESAFYDAYGPRGSPRSTRRSTNTRCCWN